MAPPTDDLYSAPVPYGSSCIRFITLHQSVVGPKEDGGANVLKYFFLQRSFSFGNIDLLYCEKR